MEKPDSAFPLLAIMRKLATEDGLDGVDLRVYMYLCSTLDFREYTLVEQLELAKKLGRRKEHVSRSIGKLKAKGLIIEASPRIGRYPSYVLNAGYGK